MAATHCEQYDTPFEFSLGADGRRVNGSSLRPSSSAASWSASASASPRLLSSRARNATAFRLSSSSHTPTVVESRALELAQFALCVSCRVNTRTADRNWSESSRFYNCFVYFTTTTTTTTTTELPANWTERTARPSSLRKSAAAATKTVKWPTKPRVAGLCESRRTVYMVYLAAGRQESRGERAN